MTDLKHHCHISFQLIPLVDKANTYAIIDKALDLIRSSGINHVTGAMETTLEGNYDDVMALIRKAQVATLDHADELVSVIKVHLRKEGPVTFDEKIGRSL